MLRDYITISVIYLLMVIQNTGKISLDVFGVTMSPGIYMFYSDFYVSIYNKKLKVMKYNELKEI